MIETLDHWIAAVGPLAFLALGLAAMIEYVFPPFPGDTILLLGGVYAARGDKPWWAVLAVITLGSVVGAAINYAIGIWLLGWFERRGEDKAFLGLTHKRFHAMQGQMRRRGTWLLLGNRFMPGIRGIIFFAAGAALLPLRRVLGLATISALAWNSLVLAVGIAVGGNAERLERLFARYQEGAVGLLLVAALGAGVRFWLKRRKNGDGAGPEPANEPLPPPPPSVTHRPTQGE